MRTKWTGRHHRGRGPQTTGENPFHQGPDSDFEGDCPVHRKTARRRSHHRQLTYAHLFFSVSFSKENDAFFFPKTTASRAQLLFISSFTLEILVVVSIDAFGQRHA